MAGIKMTLDTKQFEKDLKKLKDNIEGIDDDMEKFCRDVVSSAKLRVPVDTGRLKWSIRYVRKGKGKYSVDADADHAGYVEYGTRKMKAQPYLRPSINTHKPRLERNIKNRLDGK